MSDILNQLIKDSGNKYASLVSNGIEGSDVTSYMDTGCYILNGLVSGDIFGGIPDTTIIA